MIGIHEAGEKRRHHAPLLEDAVLLHEVLGVRVDTRFDNERESARKTYVALQTSAEAPAALDAVDAVGRTVEAETCQRIDPYVTLWIDTADEVVKVEKVLELRAECLCAPLVVGADSCRAEREARTVIRSEPFAGTCCLTHAEEVAPSGFVSVGKRSRTNHSTYEDTVPDAVFATLRVFIILVNIRQAIAQTHSERSERAVAVPCLLLRNLVFHQAVARLEVGIEVVAQSILSAQADMYAHTVLCYVVVV